MEKVADETLHAPFFIEDSSGHLLIEPFGADLDLHCDFQQEIDRRRPSRLLAPDIFGYASTLFFPAMPSLPTTAYASKSS